jgi:predicted dehydrogenase
MSRAMGVGIIGAGNVSAAYLRLAPLFRGFEIRAVADINPLAAQARAREFGIVAQSVRDLLGNDDVEIVVNLTVPAAHYTVSKQILEAGKHVYSEKPLTLSVREARELQALAKRKKLGVAAAPDTFLGGAHQQARKAIDDGLIGKVAAGTAHIMGRGMEHWHPNPDFFFKPGGGPVLDMGPYYIATLVHLIGPVRRVAALSATPRKRRMIASGPRKGEMIRVTTPTTHHALLEFANGAMVTLSASWDVFAHRHPNMELYGTEGAIFLPDPNFFGGDVSVAGCDGAARPLPAWDHPFGIANQADDGGAVANYRGAGLADMVDAIARRRDMRCGIDRMLHVVETMLAIMQSGSTGKFVMIRSSCRRPAYLGPDEARAFLR